jgi:Domain of unknown function (DUF4189)
MFTQRLGLSAVTATLLLLTACGGGSDGPSTQGAIAVSNTTFMAGIVWNAADQNTANDSARAKCGGGDCQVVLQFSDCGAISSDAKRRVFGVAEGATVIAAQNAADNSCYAKGGRACSPPDTFSAKCND